MEEEFQMDDITNQIILDQSLYPHTQNALVMLQVILQKVTAEIIHSSQGKADYYDKMCHVASDLAFWIRNIEKDYDNGRYTEGGDEME